MVAVADVQPLHPRLADGLGVLQRGYARHVVHETVDQQINLHPAEPRHIVVLVRHAFLQGGRADTEFLAIGFADFLFHLANERFVVFQKPAVLRADQFADLLQVVAYVVEDALETLLVFQLAVELLIHLVRIGNGRHGFVRAGVRHPRPRIGAVRDADAKLNRTEPRARLLLALEEVPYFLIDGNAARPTGRCVRAALDIAGEQLDTREQTTHAAHVAVAVAAHLVGQPVQDQHPVPERLDRRHDFLQLEITAHLVGPVGRRDRPVRAEHNDEPLSWPRGTGEAEAGQAHEERQGSRGKAQLLDELSAMDGVHKCNSTTDEHRWTQIFETQSASGLLRSRTKGALHW